MANLSESKLIIEGGNPLIGDVTTSGAKNSALKVMAAALLLKNGTTTLRNVPNLTDIDHMIEIIRFLGGHVDRKDGVLKIDCSELSTSYVPFELASKFRASFVTLGALLSRFHEARVALPGGCKIGARKLDLHFKGIKAIGTEISEDQGYVCAKADKLVGTKIYLDIPSNGATENIILASVLAEGETIIENAARDPEIIDLANFLVKMGCDIKGIGSSTLHIFGKTQESLHSVEHTIIPDRIEAATYIAAGMITKGKVKLQAVQEEDMQPIVSKLEEMGASIKIDKTDSFIVGLEDLVDITVDARDADLKAADITTMWYPGFPTDIQALIAPILTISNGVSTITENIYESRFQYTDELKRMGADIKVSNSVAVIKGVDKLSSANLIGPDLRGAACLIVAALAADGVSEVSGLEHLDRGYEHIEDKLISLGAKIKRRSGADNLPNEADIKFESVETEIQTNS